MDRTLMRGFLETAKGLLIRDKFLHPIAFFVIGPNVVPVMVKYKDDEEKHAFYASLGAFCQLKGATEILLINDAALKSYDSNESMEKALENYSTESPLTYPPTLRTECIIIMAYNLKTKESVLIAQPYKEVNDTYEWFDIMEDIENFDSGLIDSIEDGYTKRNITGVEL
jgi:hypothetical protein